MKAVVFRSHGGPELLEYTDFPEPQPGPGEVLLRVRACALNRLDIWVRQGLRGPAIPMPHISGCDVAGEVAVIGPGVYDAAVGSPVIVSPGSTCRRCEYCLTGWDSLCKEYQMIGYTSQGGYAQYTVVPAISLLPVPAGLGFAEAACIPLVFLTAYHMLFTRGGLKIGETVLVMAAGSGVGSAAIQLAQVAGARVLAAAGSDAKLEKARQWGASETVNYTTQPLAETVKQLTDGRGADLVIEHTGGDNFGRALHSLARRGRLVTCGATAGPGAEIDLRYLFSRQLSLLGSYMGGLWELKEVWKQFQAGRLKPVLDRTFPLAEARQAQEYMLARLNVGKLVLLPD